MSYIEIDDNLRTMTIPTDIVLLGVESDDDVNKIPFKMPKEYCGYDLSEFSARINYLNAHGDGDVYIVEDLAVDGDYLTFTWLVGRNACAYKGKTSFIVCLKKFASDGSGNVIQEFNTTVYMLPVLQGLETTQAVIQQNPDIIEYILQRIDDSGSFDPTMYYTKEEVQELIPSTLPNPESLTINGVEYDGSEPVDITIESSSEVMAMTTGKLIHVVAAIPQAVESLDMYDSSSDPVASAEIAIANKNLFRIDLISSSVTSKGITFTKNLDGSITANGTSSGTNAITSCSLTKNMFVVGQKYTLSSGKSSGNAAVQVVLTYTDNTTETIIAKNYAKTFTISKAVATAVASVVVESSGVTVSNELVYPQLEVGEVASTFVMNSYQAITYDGTDMPILPDNISNIWSNDDTVADMTMQYEADPILVKVNEYAMENQLTAENMAYDLGSAAADETVKDKNFNSLNTSAKTIIAAINEAYAGTAQGKVVLTTTVVVGTASVTLWDNRITADSTFDFYTSRYGINPVNVLSEAGYVTVYFDINTYDADFDLKVVVT